MTEQQIEAIMEQDEYVPMCGHCMIGVATTVVATGMVKVSEPTTTVRLDTPAGPILCQVEVADGRARRVFLDNVEIVRSVPTVSTWPEIEDELSLILEIALWREPRKD